MARFCSLVLSFVAVAAAFLMVTCRIVCAVRLLQDCAFSLSLPSQVSDREASCLYNKKAKSK